jgi:ABC-2 type transport system permease protein
LSQLVAITRALVYLRVTSLAGLLRSRLMRLRQPKYLVGALVGVAYIYFVFARPGRAPRSTAAVDGGSALSLEMLQLIAGLSALGILITLLMSWVFPRKAALAFTEAEIAFLFPAPVSRRMLIHYRILSSQVRLALTALILTLLFRRGNGLGAGPVPHAIGWWVILATINLHFTGSSFVVTRLLNRGLTPLRRFVVTIAIVAAVLTALFIWGWSAISAPGVDELRTPGAIARYLSQQLERGPMPWLLAIPRLIVGPFVAMDLRAFAVALVPAFAVLIVHYFWVLYSEVAFEEASVMRAEQRATRVRAIQQGDWRSQNMALKRQAPPFRLAGAGRPELAFLWKNLLSTTAFFRPKPLLISAAVVAALGIWFVSSPAFERARMVFVFCAAALLVVVVVIGPQIARQDLRADLPNSDILKTYPLRGWQIVLGELLAPTFILSVIFWLGLIAVAIAFPAVRMEWLTPPLRAAIALGIGVLAPPFCALQLLVPNAVTVLFPAWVQLVGNRSEHGLDVLGQRILFLVAQVLISVLTLVPAAFGAAVVFAIAQWLVGTIVGAALAVLTLFAVLTAEVWLGLHWVGRRFEHLDLSTELRP